MKLLLFSLMLLFSMISLSYNGTEGNCPNCGRQDCIPYKIHQLQQELDQLPDDGEEERKVELIEEIMKQHARILQQLAQLQFQAQLNMIQLQLQDIHLQPQEIPQPQLQLLRDQQQQQEQELQAIQLQLQAIQQCRFQ